MLGSAGKSHKMAAIEELEALQKELSPSLQHSLYVVSPFSSCVQRKKNQPVLVYFHPISCD